jgi:hypothetical protein
MEGSLGGVRLSVEIDGHYCSVPHALVHHSAWASVEVFFRSERVSRVSHVRKAGRSGLRRVVAQSTARRQVIDPSNFILTRYLRRPAEAFCVLVFDTYGRSGRQILFQLNPQGRFDFLVYCPLLNGVQVVPFAKEWNRAVSRLHAPQ